jgi:hypothetical protein
MKPLEKEFIGTGEVKGFKFTQITAAKHGFIYEVDTGDRKYYEVFEKRVNRRYANISYPTSKAFGIWAWTCSTITKARLKLKEIENAGIRKQNRKDSKLQDVHGSQEG